MSCWFAWYGLAECGVAWHGVVWCGVHGVVWCGVVLYVYTWFMYKV